MDDRLVKHSLGFWELRDKPGVEELQAYYANKYYQAECGSYRAVYTDEELQNMRLKLRQRHHVVKHIRGESSGCLLDVGCGEGFALAYFREQGWQAEGIDFSDAGLMAMNPGCADMLETGDVYALLEQRIAAGKRYDLLWLQNVLEHVLEPVDLLKRLRALVVPGGVMVVTVPNDGSSLQELLYERGDIGERFWIAIPDHISYFNSQSLRWTAEATGWVVHEVLADFPVDWYLMHPGSNYIQDRSKGKAAHAARVRMENLIGMEPDEHSIALFSAMAKLGLGRGLTAFLVP